MIRLSLLSNVNEMDMILEKTITKGALWLGNLKAAQNIKKLKDNNIKTVITVANNITLKYQMELNIKHKIYKIEDSMKAQIIDFFDEICTEIDTGLDHGSVLVHCAAGISRSSACVIAYLMKYMNWMYEKSFYFVKEKRLAINPNPGFKKQLIQYSKQFQYGVKNSNHKKQQSQDEQTGSLIYSKSLNKLRNQLNQSPQDVIKELAKHLVKSPIKRIDQLNRTSTPEERQIYRQQMAQKLFVNQFSTKNSLGSINQSSEQTPQKPKIKQPLQIKAVLTMYKKIDINLLESERIQ